MSLLRFTFSTMEEALVVNGLLVANKIPSQLDIYHHAHTDWMIIQALGGVTMMLPSADEQEAMEIIADAQERAEATFIDVFGEVDITPLKTRRLRAWTMALMHFSPINFLALAIYGLGAFVLGGITDRKRKNSHDASR